MQITLYLYMKNKKISVLFLILLIGLSDYCYSQKNSIKDYVSIEIVPDNDDWTYDVGENASLQLRVLRNNIALKNVDLSYEIGPEKLAPVIKGTSNLEKGFVKVNAGTMKTPGFLNCTAKVTVDGVDYTNYINIGFGPNEIAPTTILPDDFLSFWDKALSETRKIPIEPLMTLLPEQCTSDINVYHVRLQHYKKGTYVYGILCIPVVPGKYPAVLRVPGAGVKKQPAEMVLAEKNMITLSIGIHGIPQTLPNDVYGNLQNGGLNNYAFYHLDDKDNYYYRRVYTGCVRALDFLCSLPQYDGTNLGVIGGSQGGALAIVTASLDKRVKALVAYYPALCDITGYLHGRAGGWPAMFDSKNQKLNNKSDKITTSHYYDVVNFARFLQSPGYYSWGYNDPTCPPTSMYAAYNIINAPKELFVAHSTGHWRTKEQDLITIDWLCKQLFD